MARQQWMKAVEHLRRLIAKAETRRRDLRPRSRDISDIKKMLAGPFLDVRRNPVREIGPIQSELGVPLKRAWRDASERDIAEMTVNLAGLWEVSRVHVLSIGQLLKVGNKMEKERFTEIARTLFINWFSNASGHMETLKRPLARLAGFEGTLYEKRSRARVKRRPHRKARRRDG